MIDEQEQSRVERRKANTRLRIIEAALESFAEIGFSKTTVNHISAKADIGYGTFYQYYNNKMELLGHLIDELTENVDIYFHPANKKLGFRENIEYGIQGVLECYLSNKVVFIAMKEAMISDDALKEKWNNLHNVLFQRILREVERFISKRKCRNVDVDITSRAITFMLDGYAQSIMMQPANMVDVKSISLSLSDFCYYGLVNSQTI